MDYYFQDELRWAFGFNNPNKAGALIASLLPLLWIFVSAFSHNRKSVLKWVGLILSAGLLCTGWWLLFKTYSRGGIVAAWLAFCYIGFCCRGSVKYHRGIILMCALAISVLFISTRAATRSLGWIGTHEGSVENRITVWKGGLEMLAGNPQGVGHGQSGQLYMQWYQPIEMTARYRTLVNSYLTFLVERGIWIFGGVLLGALILWNMSRIGPSKGMVRSAKIGLRSSLIAFACAGFFSTTMEEWKLWTVPVVCAVILMILVVTEKNGCAVPAHLRRSMISTGLICLLLFASGSWLARKELLRVALHVRGVESTVEPQLKEVELNRRDLYLIKDTEVMGPDYGKLVRQLVLKTGLRVRVSETFDNRRKNEVILTAGEGVQSLKDLTGLDVIFLAPAKPQDADVTKKLAVAKSVTLLLPGFDEDGRVAVWKEIAEGIPALKTTILTGVGTQVEWAWETIIDMVDLKAAASVTTASRSSPTAFSDVPAPPITYHFSPITPSLQPGPASPLSPENDSSRKTKP